MADPIISDAVVEGGKNVGNAGGLLALGYMVINIFKKKVEVDDEREAKALEAMVAEMKLTNTAIANLTTKVDVMTERTSNMRADMDKLESENKDILERLSRLEGKFDHLNEQLAK